MYNDLRQLAREFQQILHHHLQSEEARLGSVRQPDRAVPRRRPLGRALQGRRRPGHRCGALGGERGARRRGARQGRRRRAKVSVRGPQRGLQASKP